MDEAPLKRTLALNVVDMNDTFEYRAAREYLGLLEQGMTEEQARPIAVALARIELSRKQH